MAKEEKKDATVSNAEYIDAGIAEARKDAPSDALHALALAGDVNAQRELGRLSGTTQKLEAQGFKIGQPAGATKYLDSDGVTVLDEPKFTDGVGSVLVKEGEVVTQTHLRSLAGA